MGEWCRCLVLVFVFRAGGDNTIVVNVCVRISKWFLEIQTRLLKGIKDQCPNTFEHSNPLHLETFKNNSMVYLYSSSQKGETKSNPSYELVSPNPTFPSNQCSQPFTALYNTFTSGWMRFLHLNE